MLYNIIVALGCFTLFAICCVLIGWAYCMVQSRREGYRDRWYNKAMKEARIDLGRRMIQEAYWLSGSNEEAFKTYHLIGVKLLQDGGLDISKFRDELKTYEVK